MVKDIFRRKKEEGKQKSKENKDEINKQKNEL